MSRRNEAIKASHGIEGVGIELFRVNWPKYLVHATDCFRPKADGGDSQRSARSGPSQPALRANSSHLPKTFSDLNPKV